MLGKFIYFGDQAANSHQIHETNATTQSQRLKEWRTGFRAGHEIRSLESDENISCLERFCLESVEKGKEKVIGERQKYLNQLKCILTGKCEDS